MRGSIPGRDAVMAWECSAMEDSPMTTRRFTTSSDHPVLTMGNHFQSASPG